MRNMQMDCNKDDAIRAKENAEQKLMVMDIAGAKKFALKAQNLYPGLDGLPQLLATLDVYISAEEKINGLVDYYRVLGVEPSADDDTIRRHFRKLALSVHPDKNKSVGADGAFKILSEAWCLLSDKARRFAYDQNRNLMGLYANVLNGKLSSSVPNGQNGFHNFVENNNANAMDQKSAAHPIYAPSPYHSSNLSTDMMSATHPKPTLPPYHPSYGFHNFADNNNSNARDQKSANHPLPAPFSYQSSNLSTNLMSATHPKPAPPLYHPSNGFHNFTDNNNANARDQKSVAHPIPTPSPYHSLNLNTDQMSATHPKPAPPPYHPLNGFNNFANNNNLNARDQKSAAHPIPAPPPYHSSNFSTDQMSATHPKPAPPLYHPSKPHTFWTTCNACKTQFEYLKIYLKKNLLCLYCRQPFFAVETPPPPSWTNYVPRNSGRHTVVGNSYAPGRKLASATYSGVDLSNRTFWSAPISATMQAAGIVQPACQKVKRGHEPAASAVATGSSNGGSSSVLEGDRPKKRRHIDEQRMSNKEREMENQMPLENGGVGWYESQMALVKESISLFNKH